MAKRRPFIPEGPMASSLEVRVVPSTFNSIGHWFSSQYHHVKDDLGISHKHAKVASQGIAQLWKDSAKTTKPTHVAHAAQSPLVTSNDTVKAN